MTIIALYLNKSFTQVSVVDQYGELKDQTTVNLSPIHDPIKDIVFYRPQDILYSIQKSYSELYQKQPELMASVDCITCISSGFSSFFWDKRNGQVLSSAISRFSPGLESLETKFFKLTDQDALKDKIGEYELSTSAVSVYKWLVDSEGRFPNAVFTSIESWVIAQLTSCFNPVTDFSCASRYGVFNIHLGTWDVDICRDLDITMSDLPGVKASSSFYGETNGHKWIRDGIPIYALVDDHQSLLMSHTESNFGDSFISADFTSVSFLFNAGSEIDDFNTKDYGISSLASEEDGLFAIESSISIPHFPMMLCNQDTFQSFLKNTELLDETGLMMMLTDDGHTVFYGVSSSTTDYDLINAYFKSVVYHVVKFIYKFESTMNIRLKEIRVGGDLAGFDNFLEYLSDVIQRPVIKVQRSYEKLLGGLLLAIQPLPWEFKKEFLKRHSQYYRQFLPSIDVMKSQSLFSIWDDCARKVR